MTPRAIACLLLLGAGSLSAAASFQTHQPADLVLGRPDFTSTGIPGPASNQTFNLPTGIAVSPVTGKVFVADLNFNRILRFSSAASQQSGSMAEAVLGQANFTSGSSNGGGTPDSQSLYWPRQLFIDANDRLWVADQENNRVLRFDNASTIATNAVANGVIGQPDFVTTTEGTTASKMKDPCGVAVDAAGRLWVADAGNSRVLRFDAPLGIGVAANGVLGQPDFISGAASASSQRMNFPSALAVEGNATLWVADLSNYRVLRFATPSFKANGGPADGVLGQVDFAGAAANQGVAANAGTLNGPAGLAVSADGTLFVSDQSNARVLLFRHARTLANGAPASLVLGQPDFTTTAAAAPDQRTARGSYLWLDPAGRLWQTQFSAGSRAVRFSPIPVVYAKPVVTAKGPKTVRTPKATWRIRGKATAAAGLATVEYAVGSKAFRRAKGGASWNAAIKLAKKRTVVRLRAVDVDGTRSAIVRVTIIRTPKK